MSDQFLTQIALLFAIVLLGGGTLIGIFRTKAHSFGRYTTSIVLLTLVLVIAAMLLAIAEQMKGSHQVTPKRSVSVDAVKVIPQPVGGFLDFIAGGDADIEGGRVLVIGPGFFSVDWVVIADSDLHRQSSGTSLEASSVVLEEASRLIAKDYGSNVSTEKLENAIRGGKAEVLVLGKRVDLGPYIEQASRKVAPVVVESIQKSLRKESESVDRVLLVGGGATFFKEALGAAFAQLTVVTTKEPVFSNARGFWLMGASL